VVAVDVGYGQLDLSLRRDPRVRVLDRTNVRGLTAELVGGPVDLTVADLPAAWEERTRAYLGLDIPDHAHGVLQDIHWAEGAFGYFPTYTLGNLYSVQFYEQAKLEIPHLEDEIAAGQLMVLQRWLGQKIHRWGRMFTPDHLAQRVTGKSLDPEPFLSYVERKYGDLYHL